MVHLSRSTIFRRVKVKTFRSGCGSAPAGWCGSCPTCSAGWPRATGLHSEAPGRENQPGAAGRHDREAEHPSPPQNHAPGPPQGAIRLVGPTPRALPRLDAVGHTSGQPGTGWDRMTERHHDISLAVGGGSRWMSYREIAEARGISVASAARLVSRRLGRGSRGMTAARALLSPDRDHRTVGPTPDRRRPVSTPDTFRTPRHCHS